MPKQTVTYWSVSMFTRKTFWLNFAIGVLAVLELQEVTAIVPAKYLPHVLAVTAALNVVLRRLTVRPASFTKPGDSKPVEVAKVDVGAADRTPAAPESVTGSDVG